MREIFPKWISQLLPSQREHHDHYVTNSWWSGALFLTVKSSCDLPQCLSGIDWSAGKLASEASLIPVILLSDLNIFAASLTFSCRLQILCLWYLTLPWGVPNCCSYLISLAAPPQSGSRVRTWMNRVPWRWPQQSEGVWKGKKEKAASKNGCCMGNRTQPLTGTAWDSVGTPWLSYWTVRNLEYLFTN